MTPIYRKYFRTAALIWVGCFLLLFFVYMLVLAPQKKHKKQVEKQLAEKKQTYNFTVQAAEDDAKSKLNEQIEQLRDRLKGFVIDSQDTANLTFDISQIANEQKVTAASIKSKDDADASAMPDCSYIREHHFIISFTAGFNQFAGFLNALERHRPVLFVDKFTISRSKEGDDSGHSVNMDLAVFVRKQQDS